MTTQQTIEQKLSASLLPVHLEVINESHQHNVPVNSETHFKVICAASVFSELNRVKRHQQVYSILADELSAGVHALALHLYTPEEWDAGKGAPASPQCMGGSS